MDFFKKKGFFNNPDLRHHGNGPFQSNHARGVFGDQVVSPSNKKEVFTYRFLKGYLMKVKKWND